MRGSRRGRDTLNKRYNYTHTYSSHLLPAPGSACAAKWVSNPSTSSLAYFFTFINILVFILNVAMLVYPRYAPSILFFCVYALKKEVTVETSKGKKAPVIPNNSKVSDNPKTNQIVEPPNPADIQPG